ncbi:MAG: Gfo/Idh/MocA family oxidoreductase [Verrucomicrobiae bacterium]|nr:Gfo/Idh/MocA family oxidoreductase [Verrucomicrobiae bacterium]
MKTIPGKVVRLGVIGVGGMGQSHCKMVHAIKKTDLTAVCDHDASAAEKTGKESGHAKIIRNFARHLLFGSPRRASGLAIRWAGYDWFLSKVRRKSTFWKKVTAYKHETDPNH